MVSKSDPSVRKKLFNFIDNVLRSSEFDYKECEFIYIGKIWLLLLVHRLPGSGKTALASRTAAILRQNGIDVKILQLDEIRGVLTPNPKIY